MGKFIDITGEVYGDLTVVARANNNPRGQVMWWCRCKCGKYILVCGGHLRNGHTKSCRHCGHITHGMTGTRQYDIFNNMHKRCEDENNPDYPNYGRRGIKVCPEWATFEGFWADMKEGYADNLTLERIDRNGDYCRENCCWLDRRGQARNRCTNLKLTINGKTQTLIEHIEDPEINIYGLNKNTVATRYCTLKWPAEKALSTPPRGYHKRI